ncbi:MAG: choice-of-anchor V domain-containing protein [Candidatus Kapaibacteriota bacterium]
MKTMAIFSVILIATTLFFANNFLYAKKNGIVGKTNSNSRSCGECHSANPSPNVLVSFNSEKGSFDVTPGEKIKIILNIQNQNGRTAGCNIAVKNQINGNVNVGTLEPAANSGCYMSKSELTHSQPKSFSNGTATFEFFWTAPNTPGTYYLQAVGLASNGNGKEDAGDIWNFAPVQAINVTTPSSVETKEENDFIINSNQNIFISSNLSFTEEQITKMTSPIIIVSADGRIVNTLDPKTENINKAFANLPDGVYIITLTFEKKRQFLKLLNIK